MPLATKNNAIIVTDGKLGTDCACCGDGGWYCNATAYPVTVSTSGWADGRCQHNGFDQILSVYSRIPIADFNGSVLTDGKCGSASAQIIVAADSTPTPLLFRFLGGTSVITADLTASQQCGDGFVSLKVSVNALLQYDFSFEIASIRYIGQYESGCININSLPSSGSWLSGMSASVTCTGTFQTSRGPTVWCQMPSQTVNVSFT